MSDKTFDLAEIEQDARDDYVMRREDTLALVAAVRAARAWVAAPGCAESMWATQDALSPFTDSQASPGAGEAPDSAEDK